MKVSVVLASKNEVVQLLMTVLSAKEALRYAGVESEIVVVDNSDQEYKAAVKSILSGCIAEKSVRYFDEEAESATKTIDRAHREGAGEFLFFTDSHCIIGHDTIKHLLDFYEANDRGKMAFLHAPIQWAHHADQYRYTHYRIKDNKLGAWCSHHLIPEPRKVSWKGMPYMIRKSVYEAIDGYGCCAKHNLGWGASYYLGPKPWLLGYENWAIPKGVSYHFGGWPDEVEKFAKYRTYGNKNPTKFGSPIAVACYVFGGEDLLRSEYESLPILKKLFKSYEDALAVAKQYGEAEREWMQANMVMSYDEMLLKQPWGEGL